MTFLYPRTGFSNTLACSSMVMVEWRGITVRLKQHVKCPNRGKAATKLMTTGCVQTGHFPCCLLRVLFLIESCVMWYLQRSTTDITVLSCIYLFFLQVKGPLICFSGIFQIIFIETKQIDMPHTFKLLITQRVELLSLLVFSCYRYNHGNVSFHFKNK